MTFIVITVILLVIAVVAFLATYGIPADEDRGVFQVAAVGVTVLVLVLWTVFSSYQSVDTGHVDVVKTVGGTLTGQTLEPGSHFIAPWDNVIDFNVRQQTAEFDSVHGSSAENQPVDMNVKLNYQVESRAVRNLYTQVGADYFNTLVNQSLPTIVKDVTAQYSATDITPRRIQIGDRIQTALNNELNPYSVHVVGLFLDNINYSKSFTNAIEQKQVATQRALQAKAEVARARYEAQSVVVKAEGQAKANRISTKALTPAVLTQLYIDKLNPNVQVIYLPSGGKTLLQLPQAATH